MDIPMTGVGVPTQSERVIHHREHVMGTVVTIDIYAEDPLRGTEVSLGLARARAILHRADAVFSTWKAESPISRLRRGEITSEEAPPEMSEVLELCTIARDMSEGWFDPWAMPGGVDPTGYVKGWAAQRAVDALSSSGITGALVNAAGDIASTGHPQSSIPFRIGVVDPFASDRLICVVDLDAAIATSGNYERGPHLIDPRSGRPATSVASASVTGPDLGLADALATALAVAGEAGLPMIEAIDDYEAFVVSCDGTSRRTERFPIASTPERMRSLSQHPGPAG
jgi:thiamine biosynthesis lipoprotein